MDELEILKERLLANCEITPAGCWLWTKSCREKGYGQVSWPRSKPLRTVRVHRVAAAIWLGFDIDSPLCVLHTCDQPRCFNPDHLYVGTPADNTADMMEKGRGIYTNPKPPMNPEVIANAIRMIEETGCSQREAARAHGFSHTTMQWYWGHR